MFWKFFRIETGLWVQTVVSGLNTCKIFKPASNWLKIGSFNKVLHLNSKYTPTRSQMLLTTSISLFFKFYLAKGNRRLLLNLGFFDFINNIQYFKRQHAGYQFGLLYCVICTHSKLATHFNLCSCTRVIFKPRCLTWGWEWKISI